MRIVFFGTSEFAVPALEALVARGTPPAAVITLPDRPQGRGLHPRPSPIMVAARAHGLTVLQPERLTEASFIKELRSFSAEVGIVAAYGKLIPESIIGAFPKGIVNIHPSLLPEFRGPSPIQYAILEGKKTTGVSLMLVDRELDHGPIIARAEEPVLQSDTSAALGARLAQRGAELLTRALPQWIEGTLRAVPQDHARATFTKRIEKENGHVNWNESAQTIERTIRAYNPWPGAFTFAKKKEGRIRIKIIRARAFTSIKKSDRPAPATLFTLDGELAISAGDGVIIIDEIQPEYKRKMTGKNFITGYGRLINTQLF